MACRDVEKGEEAAASIRRIYCKANVEVRELDLADTSSIRAFAQRLLRGQPTTSDASQIAPYSLCSALLLTRAHRALKTVAFGAQAM